MEAARIRLKDAEKLKRYLIEKENLDTNYKVGRDRNYVYFPILNKNIKFSGASVVKKGLESKSVAGVKVQLHSYDVVGDILISNVPMNKDDAKNLLKTLKHVKVVAVKTGKYGGKYRTPTLKIIAGEKRKVTTHRENGILLKLDVEKCYFSERLANERLRIAKLVRPKENVLVMFSGVGVYPLVISKNSMAKEIYGIEINPVAHKYAKINLKLNKINNVNLIKGDVKKIIPKLKSKFDRIIMPLPKTGEAFLDLIKKISKKSTVIHFYIFSEEGEINEKVDIVKKYYPAVRILGAVRCGQYAPHISRYCIDFKQ